MITKLLYKHKEKCGCNITFDAAVEDDNSPPTYELWVHRIFGDNKCKEHTEDYYDEVWPMMVLPMSLDEMELIASSLKEFVAEFRGEEE